MRALVEAIMIYVTGEGSQIGYGVREA